MNTNTSLSKRLEEVINKCIQLKPEDRYQSAQQLKNALSGVQAVNVNIFDDDNEKKKSYLWLLGFIPVFIIFLVVILVLVCSNNEYGNKYIDDPFKYDYQEQNWDGQEVYISEEDERYYIDFTPDESGVYHFFSKSGEEIPVAWLCDEEGNLLAEDNTYGVYTEFDITCWLSEGETYELETTLYDLDEDVSGVGYYMIYVELIK